MCTGDSEAVCLVEVENWVIANDTVQGRAARQFQNPVVSSGLGMPEFIFGL